MSMYSDEIKNTHDLEMNAMAPTRCRKCKYSGGDLGRFPCQTEKQTNPMNTQSTGESEGWEETWRSGRMLQACHCDSCHEQIKSFISQTITTVRREEREKVVRILESMTRELDPEVESKKPKYTKDWKYRTEVQAWGATLETAAIQMLKN